MDLPCYLLSPEKQRNNLSYKLVLTLQTITQLIIDVLIETYYSNDNINIIISRRVSSNLVIPQVLDLAL